MNSCNNDCSPVFNGIIGNNFVISPNPVYNGNINVSIKHNAPWFPNLYPSNPDDFGLDFGTGIITIKNRPIRVNISITNQLGVVLLNFPNTQMSANLNISSLPSVNYIIVFEHLGQIESHQIIKH
ncbi:MAG: T9SS type A sorting domain-containing protein [Flavobacterium sp.]